MTTTADERKFVTFDLGDVRDDVILLAFRNALVGLTNPDTGQPFTEDEITYITQPGSRFYLEADAIDLLCAALQQRARYLANQLRPAWSNTEFLDGFHGQLWLGPASRLPATGGSGSVDAPATAGSVFPGSTTIGDPAAAVATDPNGYSYQVLATTVTPAGGVAELTMKGINTGAHTNPVLGTTLTWSKNAPLGAQPEAEVSSNPGFSGGFDVETDKEYADRIESFIRHRPACGNTAHFVTWARESSVAVESAFVYPCAWYAGSVLVCVLQRRGTTVGPYARTNVAVGTLGDVTTYLTPPNSPVLAQHAHVVVVPPNEQDSDLVLQLSMEYGISGGWGDVDPWPSYSSTYPEVIVASVTSQTLFTITTNAALPGGAASLSGADAPQLMLWNQATSSWVKLDVAQVDHAGTTATVHLNTAPTAITIATGQRLSPYTDRLDIVAQALTDYFDELGPGQVVDLDTDPRAPRALRYPKTSEGYPIRAGQAVISRVLEALGGVAPDISLAYMSRNEPDLPGDVLDGPNIVTLGDASVFPL